MLLARSAITVPCDIRGVVATSELIAIIWCLLC